MLLLLRTPHNNTNWTANLCTAVTYKETRALPHVLNLNLTIDYNNSALCVLIFQKKDQRKRVGRKHSWLSVYLFIFFYLRPWLMLCLCLRIHVLPSMSDLAIRLYDFAYSARVSLCVLDGWESEFLSLAEQSYPLHLSICLFHNAWHSVSVLIPVPTLALHTFHIQAYSSLIRLTHAFPASFHLFVSISDLDKTDSSPSCSSRISVPHSL